VNLPQVSDNNCATCHTPQGELPLDASILGAHVPTNAALIHPDQFDWIPGMVFGDLRVRPDGRPDADDHLHAEG
jgi:hypothetical protein